jgi:D-glycero-alpha-D-manno-heptose-7-phosphate kinase
VIIVQTPLRVSLFGGGTDFRSYFLQEGGCVLSYAIDKCIFVTIKKRFDDKLRIGYTRTEMVDCVDEIQHELIREALEDGDQRGVEIPPWETFLPPVPDWAHPARSRGALHTMRFSESVTLNAWGEACEIEIDTLHKPIGVQDQYIAAFGDLHSWFTTSSEITAVRWTDRSGA